MRGLPNMSFLYSVSEYPSEFISAVISSGNRLFISKYMLPPSFSMLFPATAMAR